MNQITKDGDHISENDFFENVIPSGEVDLSNNFIVYFRLKTSFMMKVTIQRLSYFIRAHYSMENQYFFKHRIRTYKTIIGT